MYSYTVIMANKKEKRVMVAVAESTKNKVAKKVIGTADTIGSFFDEAAREKLDILKRWKPIKVD